MSIAFASQITGKYDVIHKTVNTSRIALSSEENQAMDTGNMYRKFLKLERRF